MNFKDSYKQEMNLLKKPSGITKKAINKAVALQEQNVPDRKIFRHSAAWRTAIAAIMLICIIGGTLQHEKIMSFAESILGIFTLSANNEKVGFGKIQPVPMNVKGFITNTGTKIVLDSENKAEPPYNYYQYFDSYKDMNKVTNIVFPCADKIEYKDIAVDIIPEYSYGHISAQIIYDGVSYNVNGMYTVEGFEHESWGYGVNYAKTVENYQYGSDKTARFVEDDNKHEIVYFTEENILFQMSFNNGTNIKEGDATATKKQVEKLLDLFGKFER